MSKSHDKRDKIKLNPSNSKALHGLHRMMGVSISFTGLVNFVLERHGIPHMLKSDLVHNCVKPKGKA